MTNGIISKRKGKYRQISNVILFNTSGPDDDIAVIKSRIFM